jgi:hypothetical protein
VLGTSEDIKIFKAKRLEIKFSEGIENFKVTTKDATDRTSSHVSREFIPTDKYPRDLPKF